jgi:hypothetical protein
MFFCLIDKDNLLKVRAFFASKFFLFLSSSIILLFSVFISSVTDIGSDSGIYLDIGKKFALGGKYYDQIFESNFPLNFYIYAFEYKIHQLTKINTIILSQIFVYIFFFICLACSFRIIKKTTIYDDKIFVNLLFLFFFIGFFLRHPSIQHNELGTKSTFFMLFFFPYFLYSLELKNDLSRKDLMYRGILMGLIPCFKPNYAIVVIAIELFKFFENKNWRFIFRLDHLVTLLVGLAMLDWMIFFEKEYFQFMIPMWREVYSPYNNINVFLERLNNVYLIIFPMFSICVIYYSRINELSYNLKINFIAFIATSLMLVSEGLISYDQIANLFFVIFFFCLFFFYDKRLIDLLNISNNKFIFYSLIIVSIADHSSLQTVIFGSYSVFWCLWILVPIFAIYYLKQKNISLKDFIKFIILYSLLFIVFYCFIIKKGLEIIAIYSIFFNFIICYLYEKKIYFKRSPNFSLISFTIVISLPIMLFFNLTNSIVLIFKDDSYLSAPYEHSDKLYYYIKKYAPNKEDQILVFINQSILKFPTYSYLGKDNKIKSATHFFYNFRLINNNDIHNKNSYIFTAKDDNLFFVDQYFNAQIIESLQDDNYKLIFLGNELKNLCHSSIVEYLSLVKQYKKLLNNNFQYVDTISVYRYQDAFEKNKYFEINGKNYKLMGDKFTTTKIEIYARKTKIKK